MLRRPNRGWPNTTYLLAHFAARDSSTTHATARELIHAHPFASLISSDDDGAPFVTPLPLHVLEDPSTGSGRTELVLLGHCANPSPYGRYLKARPQPVVTFMGPHAYMMPRDYPDLVRFPARNYLTVHCTVEAKIFETFDDKDRLLKHLIADPDPVYADQWRGINRETYDVSSKPPATIVWE